jgi:hypothetical protein
VKAALNRCRVPSSGRLTTYRLKIWNDSFPHNRRRWTLPSGLQMTAESRNRDSSCTRGRNFGDHRIGMHGIVHAHGGDHRVGKRLKPNNF